MNVHNAVVLFGSFVGIFACGYTGHEYLSQAFVLVLTGFTVVLVIRSPQWRDRNRD
jgi:uncharacterized membrane protein YfcA